MQCPSLPEHAGDLIHRRDVPAIRALKPRRVERERAARSQALCGAQLAARFLLDARELGPDGLAARETLTLAPDAEAERIAERRDVSSRSFEAALQHLDVGEESRNVGRQKRRLSAP